ncbi:unnamed protein product [Gadus morhua 'NCC']
MTWTVNGCLVALAILFAWRVEDFAEACSCSPAHPQQAFCSSDVVIRAKVVAMNKVDVGNDVYGNPVKQVKYDVKLIKMFKGPVMDIEAIYTAPISALCGVTLDIEGQMEYLITGKLESDGNVHVTLCDFIEPWDAMSPIQKKSLPERYHMGCDCKIVRCETLPCALHADNECLWTDWVLENYISGPQAQHFACIKRRDGSCAWYRGAAQPKKDFLDIEEP